MDVLAPSTQLPMAVLHAAGLAFSVCAGVVLLLDLYLVFSGRVKDEDLVMVQESEEAVAETNLDPPARRPGRGKNH